MTDERLLSQHLQVLVSFVPEHWWTGSAYGNATLLGWWDGAAIQPVTALGWWDGTTIRPMTVG
jgi:hypothetical protein